MRNRFITISILSLIGISFSNAFESGDSTFITPAEKHQSEIISLTKTISIDSLKSTAKTDSVRQLVSIFYYNQFRHAQDPELPYFMFLSKNNEFTMGVGGAVKLRGWYDWNGAIPVNGFSPYLIPIPKEPTQMRRLAATPAGTAIFMTIIGRNTKLGNIMGYIEGNFNGYNHIGFKLSRAFVTINDWTIGYAKSTFTDPGASPSMIDGAGPNGESNRTSVLVRYMHTFKGGHWSVAGSLEFPNVQINDYADRTKTCTPYIPDAVAFGQYQWDETASHIRVSGMLRTLPYRNLIDGKNHTVIGWGAMISSVIRAAYPLKFFGQVNIGRGNGSYLNDLSCDNIDLLPDINNPGKLYAPFALGATIGAQYYIRHNLFIDAILGEVRHFTHDGASEDMYKYGIMGAVNCYWYITPRVSTGVEYLIAKRKNVGGAHGCTDRVTAFFQFSF